MAQLEKAPRRGGGNTAGDNRAQGGRLRLRLAILLGSPFAGLFLGSLLGYGVGMLISGGDTSPHGGGGLAGLILVLAAILGLVGGLAGGIVLFFVLPRYSAGRSLVISAIALVVPLIGLFLGGLLGFGVGMLIAGGDTSPHGGGLVAPTLSELGALAGLAAGVAGAVGLVRRIRWQEDFRSTIQTNTISALAATPPLALHGGNALPAASLPPIPLATLSPIARGSPAMLAQLVVVSGPDKGRSFPLEDGQTFNIGRGQEANTQLTDPRISRKQCLLEVDGGKFVLSDLGSSAGTLVNGVKIARHELQPGDVVHIGDTELRLQLQAPHDQSTLAGPALSKPKPAPAVAPLKDLVGKSLQHFEIQTVLATGATGMVFKGVDTQHDRLTAIKVLWPEASQKEDELQRFVRAMKTMMNIQHENIVQIYAAGKTGPYCWVAMEYVDGESLHKVIQRIGTQGMLDWRNSLRVAVHIGRALEKAFEEQIIHRNITPENILQRHSDKVAKLGDLMLAKALEGTLARQVTKQGQLVGELVYMPPERTRGDAAVDCRSDIYGLGATCYALLTGRPPFEGDSLPEVVSKIRQAEPVKPKQFQMSVNDKFEDCVLKMLAKRPDDRYETPQKLLVDLERIARFENVPV